MERPWWEKHRRKHENVEELILGPLRWVVSRAHEHKEVTDKLCCQPYRIAVDIVSAAF